MLGTAAQAPTTDSGAGRRGAAAASASAVASLAPLYKRLFPHLLALACDADAVPKQLFAPLMRQLIHWFTSNRKTESPETATLLNSLMDGLCDTDDSALRDFAASCVQEFFSWSIKQMPSDEALRRDDTNVLSLIKRIHSMALHPSAYQRLGAALAFNHIYRVSCCRVDG